MSSDPLNLNLAPVQTRRKSALQNLLLARAQLESEAEDMPPFSARRRELTDELNVLRDLIRRLEAQAAS